MQVMIVENDALHRSFLRSTLEEILPECNSIEEAEDGVSAIEVSRRCSPDSVIMDLQMPNGTGIDAAKDIWRRRPQTKILFWSNYSDEAYVRGVAKIVPSQAVYGYLLKSASEDKLRLAIRGVFVEDQCVVDREIRGVQERVIDRLEGLTDVEYECLIDLALGLTDKTIAARRGLSTRGAQSRIQHLYEKLGLEQGAIPERDWGPVYNSRTRTLCVAFARGLLNADALSQANEDFLVWLKRSEESRGA
jgi:DNA-binding NarL/FixJ family response regulator